MTKQVPAWTLYLTGGIALLLVVCTGAIGASSNSEPEPVVKTRTITKEVKVKDDSQTLRIAELETQVTACQDSTRVAAQGFVDMLRAYTTLSEGAGNLDIDQIEESQAILNSIDSAGIGSQARECGEDIADKITGL
jgi:hypothetical protein